MTNNLNNFEKVISNIIAEHPDLTNNGFNSYKAFQQYKHQDNVEAEVNTSRSLLYSGEEPFRICLEHLGHLTQKCGNQRDESYPLKREIEKENGVYISNGILIAAAMHLGLKVKRISKTSPNAIISIPKMISTQTELTGGTHAESK
jgi:hypothetical protein